MKFSLTSRLLVSAVNVFGVLFLYFFLEADEAAEVFTFMLAMQFCAGVVSNRYRSKLYVEYKKSDVKYTNIFSYAYILIFSGTIVSLFISYFVSGVFFAAFVYVLGCFLLSSFYARAWVGKKLWASYISELPLTLIIVIFAYSSIEDYFFYVSVVLLFVAGFFSIIPVRNVRVGFPKCDYSHLRVMVTSQVMTAISYIEVIFLPKVDQPEDVVSYRIFLMLLNAISLIISVSVQDSIYKDSLDYSRRHVKKMFTFFLVANLVALLAYMYSLMLLMYLAVLLIVFIQLMLFRFQHRLVELGNESYLFIGYFVVFVLCVCVGAFFSFSHLFDLILFKYVVLSLSTLMIFSIILKSSKCCRG